MFCFQSSLKCQVTFSKGVPAMYIKRAWITRQGFLCCSRKPLIWHASNGASFHSPPLTVSSMYFDSKQKHVPVWLTHCWGQLDSNELLNFLHREASSVFSSKHFQYSSRAPQQACLSFIDGAAIPSGLKLPTKTCDISKELVIREKVSQRKHTVAPSKPLFFQSYASVS